MIKSAKTQSLQIAFDACDPAGVMFFGQFFAHAHRAIELALVDWGIPWSDWFGSKNWAAPIKHAEADYQRPLIAGRTYQTQVHLEAKGESSVTFHVDFLDGQELCARVRTVHVFIDIETKRKRSIPESIQPFLL